MICESCRLILKVLVIAVAIFPLFHSNRERNTWDQNETVPAYRRGEVVMHMNYINSIIYKYKYINSNLPKGGIIITTTIPLAFCTRRRFFSICPCRQNTAFSGPVFHV